MVVSQQLNGFLLNLEHTFMVPDVLYGHIQVKSSVCPANVRHVKVVNMVDVADTRQHVGSVEPMYSPTELLLWL